MLDLQADSPTGWLTGCCGNRACNGMRNYGTNCRGPSNRDESPHIRKPNPYINPIDVALLYTCVTEQLPARKAINLVSSSVIMVTTSKYMSGLCSWLLVHLDLGILLVLEAIIYTFFDKERFIT
jgi:hypothetical protein